MGPGVGCKTQEGADTGMSTTIETPKPAGGYFSQIGRKIGSWLGMNPASQADATTAPKTAEKPPRTVYVLHSGMRDPGNEAANGMKKALVDRGVAENDVLLMPPVYHQWGYTLRGVPQNLRVYRESANPESEISKEAYSHFADLLCENGVMPEDRVVWVGHSAGGQMGLTVSKLAADQNFYPIDSVFTLGTPVSSNVAPKEVKIRHMTSVEDTIQHGRIGGYVGKPLPENLDSNDRVVYFKGIGHLDWTRDSDPAVMDRVVQETNGTYVPFHERKSSFPVPIDQPVKSVMKAVEAYGKTSLEFNKGVKVPNNGANLRIRDRIIRLL